MEVILVNNCGKFHNEILGHFREIAVFVTINDESSPCSVYTLTDWTLTHVAACRA